MRFGALLGLAVGLGLAALVGAQVSKKVEAAHLHPKVVNPQVGDVYTIRFDVVSSAQRIPDEAMIQAAEQYKKGIATVAHVTKARMVRLSDTRVQIFFVLQFVAPTTEPITVGTNINLGFISMTLAAVDVGDTAPATPTPATELLAS